MPPLLNEVFVQYGNNPFQAMWFLFGHGLGLVTVVPIMIYYGWKGWLQYIWERTKHRRPHVMLHVQVPQLNEQSMKAVEQIFVHIYGGAMDKPNNLVEAYWDGFYLEDFSFEIVSDGGYITFYVRTPTYYRDLVEAAFYAQYPDAILTEVDDYVKKFNVEMIMEKKVQVWGSEFELEKDDVYPIKSWPLWEHSLAQLQVDPLASILETMSRLQPGEHWWFQVMAQPTDLQPFKERAQHAIDQVVESNPGSGEEDWVDKLIKVPINALGVLHDLVVPGEFADSESAKHETLQKRLFLTTPERELVEEVDRKMSRWPFKTKIRYMYFASPEQYDEKKGRRALLGALAQFRFLNALEEGVITRTQRAKLRWRYLFPDLRIRWRARRMFWAYRSRDMERGEHEGFIMSTEELASIFHFPLIQVRAPYITRATTRGVEPPTQLRFNDPTQVSGFAGNVLMESGDLERSAMPSSHVVPEPAPLTEMARQAVRSSAGMPGAAPHDSQGASSSASSAVPPSAVPAANQDASPEPPSNLPFA